jgi:hypothetical protein
MVKEPRPYFFGAMPRNLSPITRRAAAIAVGSCALMAAAAPAQAAQRYAAPFSNDAVGSCSSLAPCALDHAIGDAAAGDEVVVLPGSYDVAQEIDADVPLNVHGLNGRPRPRLVGGTATDSAVISMKGGILRHVYLETSQAPNVLELEGGTGRDLEVFSPTATGVDLKSSADGALLSDSVVRVTGPSAAVEAKDGSAYGPVEILGSTLYASDASGDALKAKQQYGGGTIVRNSIVRGGSKDIWVQHLALISADHSTVRPGASGAYTDGGSNQAADPGFVDAAGGDLRPTAGSPTVDAGTAGDPLLGLRDAGKHRRVVGSAPDMGAYEFVPAGVDASPTDADDPEPSALPDTSPGSGTSVLPPAKPPVRGRSVSVGAVKGTVRVKPAGSSKFVDLPAEASVPTGSTVDATAGTVDLTTVRDASGATQTGRFWGGRFRVVQGKDANAYTELVLAHPKLTSCATTARGKLFAARSRHTTRLWGRDHHGRFRTRGRNGQATVRGTRWLTQDSCSGTLFKVTSGAIDVRRNGARKSVRVKAGHRLLLRPRPKH